MSQSFGRRARVPALFTVASLLVAATSAQAIELIAIGTLAGSSDLSGLTNTLESGVAANVLGGMGSGLTYAGGNTFVVTPDRGPNAASYTNGSYVDNTTSYIPRFHEVEMNLTATPSGGLPYTLTPTLTATKLLYSSTPLVYGTGSFASNTVNLGNGTPALNDSTHYYFTGRSDGFTTGSSLNPNNGRFDPEGVRVSRDGRSVFISDEYGPYVYQFNRATGERINTYTLPTQFGISNLNGAGATEISGNTSGRVTNKGMEGLAISPDGSTLIGFMQSPLLQDGGDGGRYNRIVTINVATGATQQYVYDNYISTDPTGGATLNKTYNSSEIVAINDHEFLVLERDGKGLGDGSNAVVKKVYKIGLTGATPLPQGTDGNTTVSGASGLASYAVTKTQFLDLKAALNSFGLSNDNIPAKLEGLAFGQDVVINGVTQHTLWVSNDNDFISGTAGDNKFYVFAFANSELPGFAAQELPPVPVPAAGWLLISGVGALAAAARRRKRV